MIVTDYLNITKLQKENNSLTMEIIHFKRTDISMLGHARQMAMNDGWNTMPVQWETAQNTTCMYGPYCTVLPP